MQAAILYEQNSPLKIVSEIQIPSLEKGQVLVKMAYSGLCHSQIMEYKGLRGKDNYLPHMLGHEGSGKVLEVGEGVKKVKKGDYVIVGWIKGSGLNAKGAQFTCKSFPKKINSGSVTTFCDYSIISENRLIQMPTGMPLDVAALMGCAVPTGAGIVINDIKPFQGSEIAIFGLGGIGLSSLITTNLYKCSKIITVDISDSKLELAKSLGATHTINSKKDDPIKIIRSLTKNNGGVDFSIEASGKRTVIEQAFSSVRNRGGLCVFASHPKFGDKISLDPHELISGKQIRGTWGGSSNVDKDIPLLCNLYLQGKLQLEKLITKKYSLLNINEAFTDLINNKVNRPLIEIDKNI